LKEKSLRYRIHKDTLNEYLKDDLVPEGLRPKISPGVDLKTDDFMEEWNNILYSTSLRLMELLIKHYDTGITKPDEEIAEVNKELYPFLSGSDKYEYIEDVEDLLKDKEQYQKKTETPKGQSVKHREHNQWSLETIFENKIKWWREKSTEEEKKSSQITIQKPKVTHLQIM